MKNLLSKTTPLASLIIGPTLGSAFSLVCGPTSPQNRANHASLNLAGEAKVENCCVRIRARMVSGRYEAERAMKRRGSMRCQNMSRGVRAGAEEGEGGLGDIVDG